MYEEMAEGDGRGEERRRQQEGEMRDGRESGAGQPCLGRAVVAARVFHKRHCPIQKAGRTPWHCRSLPATTIALLADQTVSAARSDRTKYTPYLYS